jgi:hypothetical protein
MSTELKVVESSDALAADSAGEPTEELPPLRIDPTSFDARIAGIEPCSVIRELSKHHSSVAAYELEQAQLRGEGKTYDECERIQREAWLRQWEKRPEDLDEFVEFIHRTAVRFIDWGDIGQVWNASPADAIEVWRTIRREAQAEFFSGHYAARAFETMGWQHEAFRRAQHLAVRDGLIEEWKPRGASEYILIDQMTHAYVMQIHWTEEAMKRAIGEPRTESYEFREWARYRNVEAKANHWDKGDWDIPYQHQAEAVEQAFRLVDLCAKSFQRAARQLANIRLVRARRRERAKVIRGVRVA